MKFNCLYLMLFCATSAWGTPLPRQWFDRPLLVRALDANGHVTGTAFDMISSKPSAEGNFRPQSADISLQFWMVSCFSLTADACTRNSSMASEYPAAYARAYGVLHAPENLFSALPTLSIPYKTTVESVAANRAVISIDSPYIEGVVSRFELSPAQAFDQKILQFESPLVEAADRRPIRGLSPALKSLAKAVFQIQMSDPSRHSTLGGTTQDFGTGFFISDDGYFLTNNHVILGQADCLRSQRCQLQTMRTAEDGVRSYVTLDVQLLVADPDYDIALLKANLPPGSSVSFIPLEKKNIGPNVLTLGYPGDQIDVEDGNNLNRLTYSFGKLMGFHSRAFITSAYIYSGASGSPLLNANTLTLIGILSNGAGAMSSDGAPGIAQSIHLLDRRFGLYAYLTGVKQKRIDQILQMLVAEVSFDAAARLMDTYLGQRTLYGRARLKMIMMNHSSIGVRRAIVQKLDLN